MSEEIRVEPDNVQAAREEIERTRARMSETIGEIETVLVRKKAEIEDRLDVGARIRERPLHAVGIVLGAGFLLGLITGGGNDDDDRRRLDSEERAALWEGRARRLLAIAQAQEEELDEIEEGAVRPYLLGGRRYAHADDEYELVEEGPSRWDLLREEVGNRVAHFLNETAPALIEEVRSKKRW